MMKLKSLRYRDMGHNTIHNIGHNIRHNTVNNTVHNDTVHNTIHNTTHNPLIKKTIPNNLNTSKKINTKIQTINLIKNNAFEYNINAVDKIASTFVLPTSETNTNTSIEEIKNNSNATMNIKYKQKYNYNQFKIKWFQEGNKLYLRSIMGTYFFIMPMNWKLEALERKYLHLIEIIIFKPFWDPVDLDSHVSKLPINHGKGILQNVRSNKSTNGTKNSITIITSESLDNTNSASLPLFHQKDCIINNIIPELEKKIETIS